MMREQQTSQVEDNRIKNQKESQETAQTEHEQTGNRCEWSPTRSLTRRASRTDFHHNANPYLCVCQASAVKERAGYNS